MIFLLDGLPVFFVQKRVGLNSTHFNMYKFRTMKMNTPNVATRLLKNPDHYISVTGKFLRKFNLDELPNLTNMLKGEMKFVGPRPVLYNEYDLLQLRKEAGIETLLPGLTGLAQIYGHEGLPLETKVKYELEYKEKKTFLFDLMIILKTVTRALFGRDVSH